MPYYWIGFNHVGLFHPFQLRNIITKLRIQKKRLKELRKLPLTPFEKRNLEIEIFRIKLDLISFKRDLENLAIG